MMKMIPTLIAIFVVPLLLVELAVTSGVSPNGWAVVNVALYPLALVLGIVLHEAGHAVVGRAVALRVARMELGAGRRLARRRIGSMTLVVNALPTVGLTFLTPESERLLRTRLWLSTAGGLAASALVVWGALAAGDGGSFWRMVLPREVIATRFAGLEMLAFASALMIVLNVVPLPFGRIGGLLARDGWRLVTIPFTSRRRLRETTYAAAQLEALDLVDAGEVSAAAAVIEGALGRAPDSWSLRHSLASIRIEQGRLDEARATALALVAEPPPEPLYTWLAKNLLAWVDFRLRRDDLLPEADELSRALHAKFPSAAWALSTRGAVLLWLGRSHEALDLLEKAFIAVGSPMGRASIASCLATSCARLGRTAEADRWLERARALGIACPLLDEAAAEVDAAKRRPEVADAAGAVLRLGYRRIPLWKPIAVVTVAGGMFALAAFQEHARGSTDGVVAMVVAGGMALAIIVVTLLVARRRSPGTLSLLAGGVLEVKGARRHGRVTPPPGTRVLLSRSDDRREWVFHTGRAPDGVAMLPVAAFPRLREVIGRDERFGAAIIEGPAFALPRAPRTARSRLAPLAVLWIVLIVLFYVLYSFIGHDRAVRARGFASADRGLRLEPASECGRSVCFVLRSSREWGQGFSQVWLTSPEDADAAVELQHGIRPGSYSATVDVQLSGAGPADVGLAVLREKREGDRVVDSWADALTIEVDDEGTVLSVDFGED